DLLRHRSLGGLTVTAERIMYLHNSVGNDAACLVDDGAANAAGRAELREGCTGGSHQKNKKKDNGPKIFTRSHHRSSQSTYLYELKRSSRSLKELRGSLANFGGNKRYAGGARESRELRNGSRSASNPAEGIYETPTTKRVGA